MLLLEIFGEVILLSRSINVLNISPNSLGCCPVVISAQPVVSETLAKLFIMKSVAMAFRLLASCMCAKTRISAAFVTSMLLQIASSHRLFNLGMLYLSAARMRLEARLGMSQSNLSE